MAILDFNDKKKSIDKRSLYPSLLEAGTRSHSLDSVLSLRPHALDGNRTAYLISQLLTNVGGNKIHDPIDR